MSNTQKDNSETCWTPYCLPQTQKSTIYVNSFSHLRRVFSCQNCFLHMDSFIIRDVRLFDGDSVLENTSILVENGLITHVGRDLEKAGVPALSMPGHTLLPGLIDAHCHPYREARLSEQAFRFGITTLMDMHNLHENAVLQKKWATERKDFPDIKSCHFAATINGGWPAWVEKKLSNNQVN